MNDILWPIAVVICVALISMTIIIVVLIKYLKHTNELRTFERWKNFRR